MTYTCTCCSYKFHQVSLYTQHTIREQDNTLSLRDSSPPVANDGNHGDDLMTPPEELLTLTLQEAEQASESKDVSETSFVGCSLGSAGS